MVFEGKDRATVIDGSALVSETAAMQGLCAAPGGGAILPPSELMESVGAPIMDDGEKMSVQLASSSGGVCRRVASIIPHGGMLSTMFSICSTIIGAGILGLPAAFHSVGIVMAALYLFAIAAETIFTMNLLVRVAEKTKLRTLETMAATLLHPHAAKLVGAVRIIFCFGACVAYVITVADLLDPILTGSPGTPYFLTTLAGKRVLQLALWCVFMLPLVIPREINSLRYVSAFGISFVLFFAVVIVVHSCMNGLQEVPRPSTILFATGNGALEGLGVFIFSFVNHFNSLDIYFEMKKPSESSFALCAIVSVSVCSIMYFLSGLFGYLDFGPKATSSLLLLYVPQDEPHILVSYIGVFIKICASYGIIANSCRNSIYHFIRWDPSTIVFWKHCLLVVSLSIAMLLCGLFIPNVNMVFGFVGGVCGGTIAFIIPALLIMYSGGWGWRSVGIGSYVCTYLSLFGGVVAIVFGTAASIYAAL